MQHLISSAAPFKTRSLSLAFGLVLAAALWNGASAQFNYTFTAVGGTYTQVSAGATDLNSIEDDDVHSASIPLGFAFGYAGSSVSNVKVNSNGWISMDTGDGPTAAEGRDNQLNNANGDCRPGIFPLWDDLDGDAAGVARYETTGSVGSRVFTMEWRNWEWNYQTNAATISFQVKLYEGSNIIEFIYRPETGSAVNTGSGGASIGLTSSASNTFYSVNAAGTAASTSSATNNVSTKPVSGQIYRFTPSGCTNPTISSTTNSGPICSSNSLTLNTATSAGTAPFSYVWTGTGTFSSPIVPNPTVTGAATGTYSVTVKNWCGTSAIGNTNATVNAPPSAASAGTDQTICSASTLVMGATVPAIGTGSWTAISGPNTNLNQLSSTTNAGATFTPTAAGTYNLTWTTANSPCSSNSDQVTVTVNAPAATANAGPDNTICITGGALAANSASPGTGAWTAVAPSPSTLSTQFSSTTSPTATFTAAGGAGVYTLRWTTSRAGCNSTQDDVLITVNPQPTAANAGADQTICAAGTQVMAANVPSVGSGSWTAIAGPNTSLTQLSSTTNAAATFTPTTTGTFTLTWTTANSPCTSSDQVTVTVNAPAATANAGPDNTICITGGALAANSASPGTGAWTAVAPSPSTLSTQFSSTTSPTATFTAAGGAGVYTLRWTTSRAGCNPTQDDVAITVNPLPSTAAAGADQTICLSDISTALAANAPVNGSGAWSIQAGSPNTSTAQLSNTAAPTATFTPTTSGTYTLTWTISNSPCAPSTDNVTIVVQPFAASTTQTFSGDGIYLVPAGVTQIVVQAWGGGAAGGGSTNAGTFNARGGAGGGGGAYVSKTLNVTPGSTLNVDVGALVAGSSGANGGNGNPSTIIGFEPLIYAAGGTGGAGNTAGGNPAGGPGGTTAASQGDSETAGSDGGNGST
ncbi:MAG: glycine-rich domain-containing protein, partial [Flavobacteriales bacterium]